MRSALDADAVVALLIGPSNDGHGQYISSGCPAVAHAKRQCGWKTLAPNLMQRLAQSQGQTGLIQFDMHPTQAGDQPVLDCRGPDLLGLGIGINQHAWAGLVFVRCTGRAVFDDSKKQAAINLISTASRILCDNVFPGDSKNQLNAEADPDPSIDNAVVTLSKTERRVFDLLLLRLTEREIAQRMRRSPHTVHVHVKSIYRKLNINSRKQLLTRYAPLAKE